MRTAYVEYAYRLKIGRREEMRVDCSLVDFVRYRALFEECKSAFEIVWARVTGSLV